MSAPDSDQLEDLLAKVTPGEWCMDGICISGHNYAAGDVCYMGEPAHWSGDTARMLPNWENNATLIALAPTLAADVISLREELETANRRADLCASGQVRALVKAAQAVLDNADRPGSRAGLNMGPDGEDIWIDYKEVEKSDLDALAAALTPAPQPAGEAVPEGRWVYTSACAKFERDSVRVRAYDGSIHAGWENSQEFATAEDFYTWAKAECDRRNAYEAKCRAALFAHPPQPSVSVAEAITKAKGILSSIGVHAGGMDHSRIVTAVDHLDAALRALKGGDAND